MRQLRTALGVQGSGWCGKPKDDAELVVLENHCPSLCMTAGGKPADSLQQHVHHMIWI